MKPMSGSRTVRISAAGIAVLVLVVGLALLPVFALTGALDADHHMDPETAVVADGGHGHSHDGGHGTACTHVQGPSCGPSGELGLTKHALIPVGGRQAFVSSGDGRLDGLTPMPHDRPPRRAV